MYSKENSYEKYEYHVYEYEYISKISTSSEAHLQMHTVMMLYIVNFLTYIGLMCQPFSAGLRCFFPDGLANLVRSYSISIYPSIAIQPEHTGKTDACRPR